MYLRPKTFFLHICVNWIYSCELWTHAHEASLQPENCCHKAESDFRDPLPSLPLYQFLNRSCGHKPDLWPALSLLQWNQKSLVLGHFFQVLLSLVFVRLSNFLSFDISEWMFKYWLFWKTCCFLLVRFWRIPAWGFVLFHACQRVWSFFLREISCTFFSKQTH